MTPLGGAAAPPPARILIDLESTSKTAIGRSIGVGPTITPGFELPQALPDRNAGLLSVRHFGANHSVGFPMSAITVGKL
jgi:hypothetical protein